MFHPEEGEDKRGQMIGHLRETTNLQASHIYGNYLIRKEVNYILTILLTAIFGMEIRKIYIYIAQKLHFRIKMMRNRATEEISLIAKTVNLNFLTPF